MSTGWPTPKSFAQSARGVGQHHGPHARRAGRADGVHDVTQIVALVGVDAADQHQHPLVADGQHQHLAAVTLRRWRGEARQVSHRDDVGGGADFGGGRRPAGAKYDGDVEARDTGAGQ